jgi:DNA-3-methyladenine glycosylase
MLPPEYFRHSDVVFLSRDLIGKFLVTRFEGKLTAGMIIETEAYRGFEDRASHAYGGRRTKRTEVLYKEGGVCYVYLCYGIHHLFNIVTNTSDVPHGVLIRSIYPTEGIPTMLKRRGKKKLDPTLTSGPGATTQALGISLHHSGTSISGNEIWVEERGIFIPDDQILVGPRIGIDYAGEDAKLPWRFRLSSKALTDQLKE